MTILWFYGPIDESSEILPPYIVVEILIKGLVIKAPKDDEIRLP